MKGDGASPPGWVGLGLSVLFVALVVTTLWLYDQDSSCGEGHKMPGVGFLWPWSLLVGFLDFFAAIILSTIARGRSGGARVVGIIGGVVILASPAAAFVMWLWLDTGG